MILLRFFCETFKKDTEKCRAVIKWIINGGQSPNTREIETDIKQIKIKLAYICTASYRRLHNVYLYTDDAKVMWSLEKDVASPTSQP